MPSIIGLWFTILATHLAWLLLCAFGELWSSCVNVHWILNSRCFGFSWVHWITNACTYFPSSHACSQAPKLWQIHACLPYSYGVIFPWQNDKPREAQPFWQLQDLFCESLNTWGASVNCWDHGRINQSLEPCTIDMQPMAIIVFQSLLVPWPTLLWKVLICPLLSQGSPLSWTPK